jgi:hypothetical protein
MAKDPKEIALVLVEGMTALSSFPEWESSWRNETAEKARVSAGFLKLSRRYQHGLRIPTKIPTIFSVGEALISQKCLESMP